MVDHGTDYKPVLQRVRSALKNCSYRPVQAVECRCQDGVIRLEGRLPSFFLKQVAQTVAVEHLHGVAIENRIEVAAQPTDSQAGN